MSRVLNVYCITLTSVFLLPTARKLKERLSKAGQGTAIPAPQLRQGPRARAHVQTQLSGHRTGFLIALSSNLAVSTAA